MVEPGRRQPTATDVRIAWRAVDLLDGPAVARAIADLRPSAIYHCGGVAIVGGSGRIRSRRSAPTSWARTICRSGAWPADMPRPRHRIGARTGSPPIRSKGLADRAAGPCRQQAGAEMLAPEVSAPVIVTRPFSHAGPRQGSTPSPPRSRARSSRRTGLSPRCCVGSLDSRRDMPTCATSCALSSARPERPAAPALQCVLEDRLPHRRPLDARAPVPRAVHDRARSRPHAAFRQSIVLAIAPILADVGWSPAIPIERTLGDLLEECRREPASP